ncbi:MAG: hypothetical protein COA78_24420 [Blastopirellula sp.]|nr:MAG: hypothetical protein COA78_24420 [Blastopirellula sp.]
MRIQFDDRHEKSKPLPWYWWFGIMGTGLALCPIMMWYASKPPAPTHLRDIIDAEYNKAMEDAAKKHEADLRRHFPEHAIERYGP